MASVFSDLLRGVSQASNQFPQAMQNRFAMQQQQEAEIERQAQLRIRNMMNLGPGAKNLTPESQAWGEDRLGLQPGTFLDTINRPSPSTPFAPKFESGQMIVQDPSTGGFRADPIENYFDPKQWKPTPDGGSLYRMIQDETGTPQVQSVENKAFKMKVTHMGIGEDGKVWGADDYKNVFKLPDSYAAFAHEMGGEVETVNFKNFTWIDKMGREHQFSPDTINRVIDAEERTQTYQMELMDYADTLKRTGVSDAFNNAEKLALGKAMDTAINNAEDDLKAGQPLGMVMKEAERRLGGGKEAKVKLNAFKEYIGDQDYDLHYNWTNAQKKQLEASRYLQVKVDEMLGLLQDEKVLESIGPINGRMENIIERFKGEAGRDPKVLQFLGLMQNIHDELVVRERTGAALTPKEGELYKGMLGSEFSSASAIRERMGVLFDMEHDRIDSMWKSAMVDKFKLISGWEDRVYPKVEMMNYVPQYYQKTSYAKGLTDED